VNIHSGKTFVEYAKLLMVTIQMSSVDEIQPEKYAEAREVITAGITAYWSPDPPKAKPRRPFAPMTDSQRTWRAMQKIAEDAKRLGLCN
jgi:hypothetical protein